MGYLYLNFLENMNQGSKSWDDFYTSSLKEQYEVIKRKVGLNINLQEFLSYAFPTQTSKNYYISMPSFDRRVKHDRRGKDVIYNIVIRPEKDSYLNNVVPSNYDLMIIGDVTFNNVIDITIKGIELIDINIAKFGEIKVNCYAATATTTKSFTTRDGRSITVPDYGTRDLQSAVLTHDFVDRLCNDISSYPVPNPEEALNTFQKWQNYINFRKYYLGKQSERCEEIDDVIVCDSFMVSKETYRRNEDVFSDYLLDDIADFARGEQIILSKNVNGSESFPLIRVDINKNRKTVLSETIGKSGKGKSKYEVNLQRYTKDAMGLSPTPPAVRLAFVGAPAAAITAVMVVPILDPIRIASAPFSPMIFDSNNVCKIPIAAADDWITAVNAVPTRSPKIGIDENLANRSVANSLFLSKMTFNELDIIASPKNKRPKPKMAAPNSFTFFFLLKK